MERSPSDRLCAYAFDYNYFLGAFFWDWIRISVIWIPLFVLKLQFQDKMRFISDKFQFYQYIKAFNQTQTYQNFTEGGD